MTLNLILYLNKSYNLKSYKLLLKSKKHNYNKYLFYKNSVLCYRIKIKNLSNLIN